MRLMIGVLVFGLMFAGRLFAEVNTDQAVKVAESWLKLVDEGKYEKSWNEAASFFKA